MMPLTCPGSVISLGLVRSKRGLIALLVGLAFSVGVSLGAQAATTWTVCASGCDYSRIKAAIAAPTTLDGDTLAIAAGTYTEAGIVVNKSLTLQGERAANTIVQAAATRSAANERVFTIPDGVTVTIRALTIRYGNVVGDGGGIWNSGTLTLTNIIIRGNKARFGGGIANEHTLILINTTLRSNTADVDGGGLLSLGALTLTNVTLSGNTAGFCGGGFAGWAQTLMNTTISGNTAGYCGGGIDPWSPMTLRHVTVSGNAADVGGGLFLAEDVTLINSIIADNLHGGDCFGSAPISEGYNLDHDGSCQLTTPTDWPGTDPLLGSLQDNGGPTFTHALLPGSPALDAIPWGTHGCGTTHIGDQRGQARPEGIAGACDIGAYEVEGAWQALGAWVSGFSPHTVVCQNVTTAQVVTLSDPVSPWDCEAAGLGVTSGDRVAIHVRGPVTKGATDVGGAVAGMTPTSGGCGNRTTGQTVPFQHMVGATAASCGAVGLVVHPRDHVQMSVQGVAQ